MARLNKWETKHLKNEEHYARQIEAIYQAAVREAAAIGASIPDFSTDKPFSFSDYPSTKARIEKLTKTLKSSVTTVILDGIDTEWALANDKNSELCDTVFGKYAGKLTKDQQRRYYSTNDAARRAFAERKTAGLNLSDRVWRYTDQFKAEIEMGLDLGLRDGVSADEMSRQLRQYLRQPDKLFRRVRDEHGQLHLSKQAAAYHPGAGVYRSSYKNARRLAATETNLAYRTSDYTRWQQLDFVVGIEIKLSNNHTLGGMQFTDICDQLGGRYPKDFKFTGWHPHCRCHAVSILKTQEEMAADNERIMNGEPLDGESVNKVSDVPDNFKSWITDNEERISRAKSLPYFLRDNKKMVNNILSGNKAATTSTLDGIIKKLSDANVEYLAVNNLPKQLSETEIISRIGGGDLTQGSCSSLAFAYAGNVCGFDVLDFRDGISRSMFSRSSVITEIAEKAGGFVIEHTDDFKKAKDLLKSVKEGREYYFTCGAHAAIVRKVENGFEYLELQSPSRNGFKPLNTDVLKWRFGARKSHTLGGQKYQTKECIIDIELLKNNRGFQKMLGYINTEANKQKKGMGGSEK